MVEPFQGFLVVYNWLGEAGMPHIYSALLQGEFESAMQAARYTGLGDKLHLCNFPGEVQASQLRLILLLCDIVCQSCAEIPVLLLWLHFAICL